MICPSHSECFFRLFDKNEHTLIGNATLTPSPSLSIKISQSFGKAHLTKSSFSKSVRFLFTLLHIILFYFIMIE
jgi:hypothetical protein